MSNITSKIIKYAINNDEEAFNVIFEAYKHTVFYITKKYLRNVQDTEECVQDFFVKLWRIIPTYCEQLGNFETWLLTIARNFAIDRYRKLAKEKERLSYNDEIVNNKEDESENNTSNSYFDKLKEILTEEEYDDAIESLEEAYDEIQKNLMAEIDNIKKDLKKISATRAAAMDAQLKEQEVKDRQTFYCPQVPEARQLVFHSLPQPGDQ